MWDIDIIIIKPSHFCAGLLMLIIYYVDSVVY